MSFHSRHRLSVLALSGATATTLHVALLASPSQADSDSTLTVIGTSDVFDSNLAQTVLEPGFGAAYPQYDLQYVSKGTGAAIACAAAGAASALIVHAAALEDQFVDQGYSDEEFGRAIFWGDYVLLGPESDPAGVMSGDNPTSNVSEAFRSSRWSATA
ncbi:substrate-binding domain-containing protein [Nocardioides sp. CN2-186]|uniref:substrate-binding domain-containing protein n=1 Tax=Nocardioides tweenelious TaxID=3156607 RepID=UPI0032B625C2